MGDLGKGMEKTGKARRDPTPTEGLGGDFVL
jgi:hypothetical protein